MVYVIEKNDKTTNIKKNFVLFVRNKVLFFFNIENAKVNIPSTMHIVFSEKVTDE